MLRDQPLEQKEKKIAKQSKIYLVLILTFYLNCFFLLFKSTEIKVETSFDRVKTQTLLKLITKPIMLLLF